MSVEEQYANSIAIVYPAHVNRESSCTFPIDPEINSHCTVIYLGEIPDVSFTREELRGVLDAFIFPEKMTVPVSGYSLFGPEHDFLVLRLQSPVLQNTYKKMTKILTSLGINSPSKYPSYLPHITVVEKYKGPTDGLVPPTSVTLTHPVIWWGNERG